MAIVLILAALLTSCSHAATNPTATQGHTDPTGSAAALTAHTVADVAFAQNMIPHHQQAVVLAAMVPAHTANTALRAMATRIGADQRAEIRTLTGLLTEWGVPADPTGVPASNGAGMAMAGMVDQATLQRLGSLDDDAFDTLWVTSMIGHHRGAIVMAQDEIAHGHSVDAIHVAALIITAQQREIATMTHLISASR